MQTSECGNYANISSSLRILLQISELKQAECFKCEGSVPWDQRLKCLSVLNISVFKINPFQKRPKTSDCKRQILI